MDYVSRAKKRALYRWKRKKAYGTMVASGARKSEGQSRVLSKEEFVAMALRDMDISGDVAERHA